MKAGNPISLPVMRSLADLMLVQRAAKDGAVPLWSVGKNRHQEFLGQFRNIDREKTTVMERMRVQGATCLCLEHHLDLFQAMVCSLLAENVTNLDETGV
jgi:hypothetical protein